MIIKKMKTEIQDRRAVTEKTLNQFQKIDESAGDYFSNNTHSKDIQKMLLDINKYTNELIILNSGLTAPEYQQHFSLI